MLPNTHAACRDDLKLVCNQITLKVSRVLTLRCVYATFHL